MSNATETSTSTYHAPRRSRSRSPLPRNAAAEKEREHSRSPEPRKTETTTDARVAPPREEKEARQTVVPSEMKEQTYDDASKVKLPLNAFINPFRHLRYLINGSYRGDQKLDHRVECEPCVMCASGISSFQCCGCQKWMCRQCTNKVNTVPYANKVFCSGCQPQAKSDAVPSVSASASGSVTAVATSDSKTKPRHWAVSLSPEEMAELAENPPTRESQDDALHNILNTEGALCEDYTVKDGEICIVRVPNKRPNYVGTCIHFGEEGHSKTIGSGHFQFACRACHAPLCYLCVEKQGLCENPAYQEALEEDYEPCLCVTCGSEKCNKQVGRDANGEYCDTCRPPDYHREDSEADE